MSFQALAWAAKQKTGGLATKAALMALANYADEHGHSYPSTAAVAEFGEMDHKTATVALDRLIAGGFIVDTGERTGRTKQVKIYRLLLAPAKPADDVVPGQQAYTYIITNPETGEFYIGMRCCAGNPAEDDSYFGSGLWPTRMAAQGVTLTKEVLTVHASPNRCRDDERRFIEEAAGDPLCRNVEFNPSEKGRVKTDGFPKAPVFTGKAPQKRGTDTIRKPSSKASPSSRKRAAKPPAFVPPSDIPETEWDEFEAMRRRIGKPMTDKARELAVGRLRKLAEAGWPPGDVLNHSILNNYQGLFPPKDDLDGNRQSRSGQGLRGGRPDPAVDLLRYAEACAAEEAASGDHEAGSGLGLPLPAYLTD